MPGVSNTKYANLSVVSGFPPPVCYSVYKDPINCDKPLTDYDEALKLAKKLNKPIMIDFTGWACVNCRKMEENVWTKTKEIVANGNIVKEIKSDIRYTNFPNKKFKKLYKNDRRQKYIEPFIFKYFYFIFSVFIIIINKYQYKKTKDEGI